MFGDLGMTFYQTVVAAYDEYARHRDGDAVGQHQHLTSALRAASALFHFREYLPDTDKLNWKQVVALCPEYRLVSAVANAGKHATLTKNDPLGKPLVQSVDSIEEVTMITRFQDSEGEYVDARNRVFANCTDGVKRDLDEALTTILNFWGERMKHSGVVDYVSRQIPPIPGSRFVPRSEAKTPKMEVVRHLGMKHHMQLLVFDAQEGRARPMNLTGHHLEMRIYEPSFWLDIQIQLPDGSEALTCSLPLTEAENQRFVAMNSKIEKARFKEQLVADHHDEVQRLLQEALDARSVKAA